MIKRILLLILLSLAFSASARDVEGLYRGEAVVVDRSAAELTRGARRAMDEVLVKLTGRRGASFQRAQQRLAKRASDLMLQYAFEPRADELVLVAEFDQRALDDELEALNIAVWGKERPDTVVWLVLDAGQSRQLIGGDEPGLIGETVQHHAEVRGIPVLLPLMDIDESQHLSHAGDWEGLATTALALSSRYATPASLVGHIHQSAPGIWEGQWRLQVNGRDHSWEESGDILELLLENAVDVAADTLSARFADPQRLSRAEPLSMAIYGIQSAEDYARVANYLASLDTVRDLFISNLNNERLLVRFSARGGRDALAASIAFGRVLEAVPGAVDAYQVVP